MPVKNSCKPTTLLKNECSYDSIHHETEIIKIAFPRRKKKTSDNNLHKKKAARTYRLM